MGKDNSLGIVAVVAILAVFVLSSQVDPATGQPYINWGAGNVLNPSITPSPTPGVTPTPSLGPSATPFRPNLQALFVSYVVALGVDGNCTAIGGDFVNTASRVGCFDTVGLIDTAVMCNLPVVLAAENQCIVVGGTWVYNAHNAGCYYA